MVLKSLHNEGYKEQGELLKSLQHLLVLLHEVLSLLFFA